MKQLFILPALIILFTTCGNSKSESDDKNSSPQTSSSAPIDEIASDPLKDLATGSETCTVLKINDSTVFTYANYKIATQPDSGNPGERIWIFNNNTWHHLACDEAYFKGLINNYIILDYGTSTVRGLEVRDLTNDSLVFSESYYDDLHVENSKIHFWAQVEPDANNRPNCEVDSSSGLTAGYVEDQYFDIKTLTSSHSGIIKCYMFE